MSPPQAPPLPLAGRRLAPGGTLRSSLTKANAGDSQTLKILIGLKQRLSQGRIAPAEVIYLGRCLRVLKAQIERNKISPAAYYREVADRLDHQNAQLDHLFLELTPRPHSSIAPIARLWKLGSK